MIGRKKELQVLDDCRTADRSRLVVVYGRRRVGKTFLVREAFDYHFTFTHTGIENGTYQEQLSAFWRSLAEQGWEDEPRPRNWMEAFELLKRALKDSPDERKTVFIDELPWMDTPRSGFVKAIEYFWNGWASARKDIVLVVCGSAAAWMTKKILQNKGGLFNRANQTIYLSPFTLAECEQYLSSEGMVMDRKDIASAYMVFGGAPYYWSLLNKGESLSQGIDRLFFSPGGTLVGEFTRLYRSVFENPEPYVSIVSALATKKIGMTREELVGAASDIANNGRLTECLNNLEVSGFVRRYVQTGNARRESIYQLVDNYTLFYFSFVKDYAGQDRDHWLHLVKDPQRIVWEGLAFERVCLQHVDQIRRALGISGVATDVSEWHWRSNDPSVKGVQIDLVIERGDHVTNLCEMKFASEELEVSSDYAKDLREKCAAFKRETKTKNACHVTLVTTYGVKRGKNTSIVQSEVTLDDLFA